MQVDFSNIQVAKIDVVAAAALHKKFSDDFERSQRFDVTPLQEQ